MQINNNNYGIAEIIGMLERKELLVNQDYQRGTGLWPDGPASYFIDTILEGYPFPKVYMYEFINRSDRKVRKELVDGQQRITTIHRFYNNKFDVKGESKYSGLYYKDLHEDDQLRFASYAVSVDVIRNASRAEILQMFRRMNAYTLPLNDPEKRHSTYQGAFKWFVNEVADDLNEFFVEFGVFTDRQILRMADAELIAECVLAAERGVISTSASDLDKLYKQYDDLFPAAKYIEKLNGAFDFIVSHLGNLRKSHMMKPYALLSLITGLVAARWGIEKLQEEKGIAPIGSFASDPSKAAENLFALAQAHEAKENEGRYAKYVWGCEAATNRAPRRMARVMSVLRALGVPVQDPDYASLF